MVDLSEFISAKPVRKCITGRGIAGLSPDDLEKLNAALDATHIRTSDIVRWLNDKGIYSKHTSVSRHRSGECSCPR